jgi:hypothetical protein
MKKCRHLSRTHWLVPFGVVRNDPQRGEVLAPSRLSLSRPPLPLAVKRCRGPLFPSSWKSCARPRDSCHLFSEPMSFISGLGNTTDVRQFALGDLSPWDCTGISYGTGFFLSFFLSIYGLELRGTAIGNSRKDKTKARDKAGNLGDFLRYLQSQPQMV